MSFAEFLASTIDSLAWPVILAWLAVRFKDSIGALIGRLTLFKYKGLEAEFEQKLEQIGSPPTEPSAPGGESDEGAATISIFDLADISPRAAIMESWIKIERATRDYLNSVGIERRKSYQGLHRLPSEIRKPLEPILSAYQELRLLRNKAANAHDIDLNSDLAREYADIALSVERTIREAAK